MKASSLKVINEMTKGHGYEDGLIEAFFGASEAGKSILLIQEMIFSAAESNKGGVIVDTEGGDSQMLREWGPVFEKRFNTKISPVNVKLEWTKKPKRKKADKSEEKKEKEFVPKVKMVIDPLEWDDTPIFVVRARGLRNLCAFFGAHIDLRISARGKMGVRYLGPIENMCNTLLEEYNTDFVVVDSLSNPLAVFSGGLVNYPARAEALKLIFRSAQEDICDVLEPTFIMSHHATFDPQNKYSEPSAFGGKWVKHNTKVSYYLKETGSKKKEHSGIRFLYLTRWFDKKRFAVRKRIRLTDNGFIDVEEKEDEK